MCTYIDTIYIIHIGHIAFDSEEIIFGKGQLCFFLVQTVAQEDHGVLSVLENNVERWRWYCIVKQIA